VVGNIFQSSAVANEWLLCAWLVSKMISA
jgi:hypothetical protein